MESTLNSKQDTSTLIELIDILFVPSSFLRFAHKKRLEGIFQPKEKFENSKFTQIFSKIYPYLSASFLEGFRLYGYYKLAERLIS